MNGQSFSSKVWKIEQCFLILGILLLTSSCSLFQNGNTETVLTPDSKPGLVTQNRIRTREQKKMFLCLIAEQGKPFSFYDEENGLWLGAEPEIIRIIAEKLKMDVAFVPVPASALAAALRNGRGDIAIGQLTTRQISSVHQTAVFPYASAQNDKFAFMVRNDDAAWKNTIEKAAAGIDGNAILKRNAEDLKPISVELGDKGNSEKVISISVDLQAPSSGKESGKK